MKLKSNRVKSPDQKKRKSSEQSTPKVKKEKVEQESKHQGEESNVKIESKDSKCSPTTITNGKSHKVKEEVKDKTVKNVPASIFGKSRREGLKMILSKICN